MTSTSFNIGMSLDRNSSRVLKPPGGGHTNIFGEGEAKAPNARPKYDQQNSSNLNFCMNTTDPNLLVEQKKHVEVEQPSAPAPTPKTIASPASVASATNGRDNSAAQTASDAATVKNGGRVPPGGFSSGGFW